MAASRTTAKWFEVRFSKQHGDVPEPLVANMGIP